MQYELRDMVARRRRTCIHLRCRWSWFGRNLTMEYNPKVFGRDRRERHRRLWRMFCIQQDDDAPGFAIVTGFERLLRSPNSIHQGCRAIGVLHHQRNRAKSNSAGKCILNPRIVSWRRNRNGRGLLQVAIGKHRIVGIATTATHRGMQRGERYVALRKPVSNNRGVRIVLRDVLRPLARTALFILKGARVRRRWWEPINQRLAAFNDDLAPHIFLHALLRLHPRPSRLAPARRAVDRLLHPEVFGEFGSIEKVSLPLWSHINHALLDHLGCRK